MRKIFVIVICCFATCGLFAQKHNTGESNKFKTDVENFINDCSYIKKVYVDDFKTKSCIMEIILFIDKKTDKKLAGIHLKARDIGAEILTLGAAKGGVADLGYLDVEEIDDVLLVLNDVVAEVKQKQKEDYELTYTSKSDLVVSYSSEFNRLDIKRIYSVVDEFGVPISIERSTSDITVKEVEKLIKKLSDAQTTLVDILK